MQESSCISLNRKARRPDGLLMPGPRTQASFVYKPKQVKYLGCSAVMDWVFDLITVAMIDNLGGDK